jgi:hypothetical protein
MSMVRRQRAEHGLRARIRLHFIFSETCPKIEKHKDMKMNDTIKKISMCVCFAALILASMTGCAPGPKAVPEPKPEPVEAPPAPSGFVMKSFHHSMKEAMEKSYDRANEIIFGVFTATHKDEKTGLLYYFSDFSQFDKQTLSWSPPQNVIMKIQQNELKPEIIWQDEFKRLIDLDKIGICWDYYQGNRNVFLVEGRLNLIFLESGFDEASSDAYRHLIDAYPVTDECRAKDVFDLMIQDRINSFTHTEGNRQDWPGRL